MQGSELREIRKGLGLRQPDLAAALNLSVTFISQMENGRQVIDRRTALAVRYLSEHPEAVSAQEV